MGESTRTMLVLAHTGRENAVSSARQAINRLASAGVEVRVTEDEAPDLQCSGVTVLSAGPKAAEGAELVIVLGGDGSLLRAAEIARPAGTPLIGVNLGHVGFLAEADPDGLDETVDRLVAGEYRVEERMTVDVVASVNGTELARAWALNELSVEKSARERMIEVMIEVDGHPLSRWGCDGVVCATPTGSTAYAFSAGGPVVWPGVEALLVVPLAAHALFARPLVVSPRSVVAVELVNESQKPTAGEIGRYETDRGAVMWCDGRRMFDLPPGARVEVRRGSLPVLLARVHGDPAGEFTGRLVAKFGLPVTGWRGPRGLPPCCGAGGRRLDVLFSRCIRWAWNALKHNSRRADWRDGVAAARDSGCRSNYRAADQRYCHDLAGASAGGVELHSDANRVCSWRRAARATAGRGRSIDRPARHGEVQRGCGYVPRLGGGTPVMSANTADPVALRDGPYRDIETLIRATHAELGRVAFRCLGNRADAEDAVQLGCIKVLRCWTKVASFATAAQQRAYLVTTVINETLQIRRQTHRKREVPVTVDTEAEGWMPEFPGGQGHAAAEQLRRVWHAISELPDENREVMLLFAAGYEYAEIAEMLDIAVSTVRSHVCTARRRLPRAATPDREEGPA